MCEGIYFEAKLSPPLQKTKMEVGRETGLEPATTGITIPRNCVAYIQLKLEGGETGNLFNLSYTWVTQFRVNYMSILHLMCEGGYIN